MARIRSIKPAFFRSPSVADLPSDGCRLTWIGMWTYCDDHGRAPDDARLVKAEVWPIDDRYSVRKVERDLVAIAAAGMICRYEAADRRWLHCVKWDQHQRVNRPQPSVIPACPIHESTRPAHDPLTTRSLNDHDPITTRSLNDHDPITAGREGSRKRKSSSSTAVTHEPRGETSDDDDQEAEKPLVNAVLDELCRRHLDARQADKGPVGDPPAWLRADRKRTMGAHVAALLALDADDDPIAVADRLEPRRRADPLDTTIAADRARYAANAARAENPCESCEGSGWVIGETGAIRCESCEGSGIAPAEVPA